MTYPIIVPNGHIYELIADERARQERLKAEGKFEFSVADREMSFLAGYAILGEEFGEVGREVLALAGLVPEGASLERLRKELVQVGAVVVAMIERVLQEEAG